MDEAALAPGLAMRVPNTVMHIAVPPMNGKVPSFHAAATGGPAGRTRRG